MRKKHNTSVSLEMINKLFLMSVCSQEERK